MEHSDLAEKEAKAALGAFAAIGATREAARARMSLHRATLPKRSDSAPLTAREVQVLRLISEGLGNKKIASALTLSEHTVHKHVANIYAKLGCSTRAAAVTQGHRLGILHVDL